MGKLEIKMKNVVIVESPAKAKTINRYLGKDFTVVASYGHVRDLPSKNGSVKPDEEFSMIWELDERGNKQMQEIVKLAKGADALYMATDPDREGEAISWHVLQVLEEKGILKKTPVSRIVFYEITKNAVQQALNNPRPIHQPLVDAYLARRALDYLVGFSISPLLWRKLPGARSAGRVQSVALRLIVDRETEIEAFKAQEYWSVEGLFANHQKSKFSARLTHLDGKKLTKFDIANQEMAQAAVDAIRARTYQIASIEKKQVNRNPSAPFSTSTLQQEASRKLGFGASRTMQIAQKLYEGIAIAGETTGLITYMRTDSTQMAAEAIQAAREYIGQAFGKEYVPASARVYKSKAKNAQEAHEAIRPTQLSRTPEEVRSYLDDAQYKLYDLIWKRAMASQMASALFDQVGVDVASEDKRVILRATGSTLVFDGFLKLYQEGKDDEDEDENNRRLPPLQEGEALALEDVSSKQHFTQPPPRYSEASLVKKLEELGIGRPSTYASILSVLQDRKYVRLESRQFFPEDRGRLVTAFLVNYFSQYVEYDFTANLEEQLDEISAGARNWKDVMNNFWGAFHQTVKDTEPLRQSEILTKLEEYLAHFLFPGDAQTVHKCPKCSNGEIHLKVSKFGAFLGCSNYPECNYTRAIAGDGEESGDVPIHEVVVLGVDPSTQQEITLRKGPYGFYFQWEDPDAKKPRRATLPSNVKPEEATLDTALSLAVLPRRLGKHPNGEELLVNVGRFGPYVKCGSTFASIPKTKDMMTLTLDEAIELVNKKLEAGPSKRRFTPRKKKS